MLYIITGQERLLMDNKIDEIRGKYPVMEETLNFITIDCREMGYSGLQEELSAMPFFSDYKIIILKNPYFLTAEKVKVEKENELSDKQLEGLVDLLTSVSKDNSVICILFQEGKLDERKKIVKTVKKLATVCDFPHLDAQRLKDTCHAGFKRRKTTIDEDALQLLLKYAGDDLIHLRSETDKLCLYKNHITLEDVKLMVPRPIEDDVYEISKGILNKNVGYAFSIYQDLILNKEEPVRLVNTIATSVRALYQVKLLDRKGYSDSEIAKYLGMNPYRLKYIRQDSRYFEINDLLKLLDDLAILDEKIKTGKIDRFLGLEQFILNVVRV